VQNLDSFFGKRTVTEFVVAWIPTMNGSINFDRQARAMAIEVYDVTADDVLPAEVKAIKSVAAKRPPQDSFLATHLTPQRARHRNGCNTTTLAVSGH
jgi:hypothetical protein